MTQRRTLQSSRRGQAAVESAIVLPLFVFLILGLIQLGLAHQARLMTKYAAFKAARAGSIHSAKMEVMERAALGALLPFLVGGGASRDHHYKSATPQEFVDSWQLVGLNKDPDRTDGPQEFVHVAICNPTTAMYDDFSRDFDDPDTVAGDWQEYSATRLNLQVTLYYRMPIPFANTVLWWITRGGENQGMMDVLRMKPSPRSGLVPANPGDASHSIGDFEGLAANHVYVLPVRESYGLRMQSNFLNRDGFRLPDRNACTISWKKSSP